MFQVRARPPATGPSSRTFERLEGPRQQALGRVVRVFAFPQPAGEAGKVFEVSRSSIPVGNPTEEVIK